MTLNLWAGIDAGGTEFKCILGRDPDHILARHKVAVTTPEETLPVCKAFFKQAFAAYGEATALGLGCFGPLNLNVDSPHYGHITTTPKTGWTNTPILNFFKQHLNLPIYLDTDVNAALLAEVQWGAAQGLHSAVYATLGTGIGAGVMINGRLLHGAMHAEAGHLLIPRHPDDAFAGVCPFHGDCLEGLASGPAITQRWGQSAASLPDLHPAWNLQAHYMGVMCANLALVYSPQRIVLGGGVMQRAGLLPNIQEAYRVAIHNYLGQTHHDLEQFIQTAQLGEWTGALGAIALAQNRSKLYPFHLN